MNNETGKGIESKNHQELGVYVIFLSVGTEL